ncbi:MAG: hypothetical protein HEEMFOPI_01035 [Holosporales bacterium]
MFEIKSVILLVLFICINVMACFAENEPPRDGDTCTSHTTEDQLKNQIPK